MADWIVKLLGKKQKIGAEIMSDKTWNRRDLNEIKDTDHTTLPLDEFAHLSGDYKLTISPLVDPVFIPVFTPDPSYYGISCKFYDSSDDCEVGLFHHSQLVAVLSPSNSSIGIFLKDQEYQIKVRGSEFRGKLLITKIRKGDSK